MSRASTPTPSVAFRRLFGAPRLWLGVFVLVLLSTCSVRPDALTQVRALGTLRVAMTNSPTTYYVGPDGATGYEYDLVRGLATSLGVELEVVVAGSVPAALGMVERGRAHLAAAAVTVTPAWQKHFRFTPPVQKVVPQLVYRVGAPRPRSLAQLDGRLAVPRHSAAAQRLRERQRRGDTALRWEEPDELGTEDLLHQVANGALDYTIANSDLIAINQRYYPNLAVAFPLADSADIAWAFPTDDAPSLFERAVAYLQELPETERETLHDRHFGHVEQVNALGALALALHVETRLPKYRAAFEKAAAEHGLDWRLLAAMGYQESQWDAHAVSPTGVRGLMQLTAPTAARMNVSNRDDPFQSIQGGARYIRLLMDQLPAEIRQPDRTWMALAAYNLGIGHVLDARRLAVLRKGDPDRWLDVRDALPLLTKPRWYAQTRYGYARGYEAMVYVGNVRTFYDMLVWLTEQRGPQDAPAPPPPPPSRRDDNPLHIHSPLL